MARPTMTRSDSCSTPFFVEMATSIFSSSSLCTLSSSVGRMPTHARIAFALTFTIAMNGYMSR